ncbi:MAG: hypothetical protein H7836_08125 [Magnetococcus sp. YQC-3]
MKKLNEEILNLIEEVKKIKGRGEKYLDLTENIGIRLLTTSTKTIVKIVYSTEDDFSHYILKESILELMSDELKEKIKLKLEEVLINNI